MFYSDELVEEVRSKNDIVEVVSEHVRLQKTNKRAAVIGGYALSTTRNRPLFPSTATFRYTIASDAGREGMYIPL